jgi:hypothetical protein
MKNTYRPLPKSVTIKQSKIEGLGLFAIENIPAYTVLGIAHVYDEDFENRYIRTPLGGFLTTPKSLTVRLILRAGLLC